MRTKSWERLRWPLAIAKSLPDVEPQFMQVCPICERSNRMVVKGVYVREGKRETYPDIGYSFCNCKDIFYTNPDNVMEEDPKFWKETHGMVHISQPDPFFCEWGNNPYSWDHWNPRKHQILWDMHSLVRKLEDSHFEVLRYWRDFETTSDTPQHFHIIARKP